MVDRASVLGDWADTGDVKGYKFLLSNIGTLKLPQEVQPSGRLLDDFGNMTVPCPVISPPEKPTERVREMLQKNPNLKPTQVQSAFVMASLRTGEDWDKVEKEAAQLLDRKWIANQKQSVKRSIHPSGENSRSLSNSSNIATRKTTFLSTK